VVDKVEYQEDQPHSARRWSADQDDKTLQVNLVQ
jgi:hypothetical protein